MAFLTNLLNIPSKIEVLPSLQPIDWLLVQMNGWIGNFALTMIIFTIFLKIITFPLDFMSRSAMKKNALIQKKLEPQLKLLEKKCKGDKQLYQTASYQLLRKNGQSMAGMCLPMLVTVILFLFVFNSMGRYTAYTNSVVYNTMVDTYEQVYNDETLTDDLRAEAMIQAYKKANPSFLWIRNTLRPDGYNLAIDSFEDISKSSIGSPAVKIPPLLDSENGQKIEGSEKQAYEMIMGAVITEYNYNSGLKIFGKHLNGWFLLPILAAGSSLLSQWISQKTQGATNIGQNASMQKTLMFVFPAMMFYFALQYTSAFSLYILTNSLITIGTTYLINFIVGKKYNKLILAAEADKVSYSR